MFIQSRFGIVLAFLVGIALYERPQPVRGNDESGLVGRWQVITAMYGGKPVKDAVGEFIVFASMTYVEEDRNGRETSRGIITIDDSVEPATIDALSEKKYLNHGVFELRGDSLEICWGYKKRPGSLDSAKDKTFFHIMLVRVPQ